eukprot:CAMPEP_0172705468 /NCGR_PEP_ID=MMETSP1074-20121228/43690_1 /TAXON_ID=2916 /ORGANISM="Ceratium fusus, Strain PA161109" /LENGTH=34 /DNA_ID= /DNA_START= /DNA_END= /DNA_ORIENTATION=
MTGRGPWHGLAEFMCCMYNFVTQPQPLLGGRGQR